MQRNTAQTPGTARSNSPSADDAAINAQLLGIIKANALRQDGEAAPASPTKKLSYYEAGRAFIALLALMVVAYIYSLLVKNEA